MISFFDVIRYWFFILYFMLYALTRDIGVCNE